MKNYFSYFSIDGATAQPIKGITNGETWNGWATPYFEKSTMFEIIENYNLHSEDGSKLEFSEEKNCVVYVDSEDIYEQSTLTHEGETYYTCDGFCWIEKENFEELTENYQNWLIENNFPQMSADELLYDRSIIKTLEQENYLFEFIQKWDSIN